MSQTKKSLQDLTLLDRFLFAEVMEDAETFENVLKVKILIRSLQLKHQESESPALQQRFLMYQLYSQRKHRQRTSQEMCTQQK